MDDAPLYTARLPVRWADQDELGHVNNAVYFTYFEQARIEFLQGIEAGRPWPGPQDAGPVLVAAEAAFKRPVVYPATVLVDVFGGEPGRTSAPLVCRLTVEGDEGTLYAEATTTLVWIDRTTGRPVPLPDALRARLAESD